MYAQHFGDLRKLLALRFPFALEISANGHRHLAGTICVIARRFSFLLALQHRDNAPIALLRRKCPFNRREMHRI